jgi:CHAD domain-containing protein
MTVREEPAAAERPGSLDEAAVGTLLQLRLEQQLVRLREQEAQVRRDGDGGIHKMRIAIRRLRSALATYRPVLAPGATVAVREELRWLGGELSPARDAQVLRERLEALVAEQPVELVMGPVRDRIHTELTARYQAGRLRAVEALDSPRYAALLRQLELFVLSPPYDDAAGQAAREELPRLLERDLKRVRRRAGAAEAAQGEDRDRALHETRKAAKRLRYAAESAAPVLGRRAKRLANRAMRIQEVLGEHQDTVVARQTLRELGAKAYLEHENGFTFGRLHALEQARAEVLVGRVPAELARLPRGSKKRRRGL